MLHLTPQPHGPQSGLLPAPATAPAPLPDVAGGEIHLLPRSAWSDPGNPLKVTFPLWENSKPSPDDPEYIRIFLGDIEVAAKQWSAPIASNDLFVTIPSEKLPPGEHLLTYIVTIWSQTEQGSLPLTLTVDKEAPLLDAHADALIFPAEVSSGITAAYLAAHHDQVLTSVPAYTEKKVGDVITWYWEVSPRGRDEAGSLTVTAENLGEPLHLAFSGEMLRARENGARFASYRVRDRAGNESTLSTPQEVLVNIRPPEARPHPTVKEIKSDGPTGTLDPFRGVGGITVVVPAAYIDPGEAVQVDFIGQGGAGGVGSVTHVIPASGNLELAIPAAVVAANIPVANDGRSVVIHYLAGADTQPSNNYILKLSALPAASFGKVTCAQAQVGSPATLSKSKLPSSGAVLQVGQWSYQAVGQPMKVWAEANGVRKDLLTGEPLKATGSFTYTVARAYIQQLAVNSTLRFYVSVSFDKGRSYQSFEPMFLQVVA